ncbi:MAG: ComF family protein [Saprospiraceae bacterium]
METVQLKNKNNSILKNLRGAGENILELFFPHICLACEEHRAIKNHLFCVRCAYEIKPTEHWQLPNNEFTQKFIGRIPLVYGASLYKFYPGGLFQKVIHKLKYQSRPEIGVHLGRIAGKQITAHWSKPDLIIPVPIHPKKMWKRGYNQAERIASGMAEILDIPILDNILVKKSMTQSQTGFHRMERMKNVENAYDVNHIQKIRSRHILLVDDVLTTGATLEACAIPLLQVADIKLSMVTLAMGQV